MSPEGWEVIRETLWYVGGIIGVVGILCLIVSLKSKCGGKNKKERR